MPKRPIFQQAARPNGRRSWDGIQSKLTIPMPTEAAVLDALRQVRDPDLLRDIVSLGFVQDLSVQGGRVSFRLELTTPACPVKDHLKSQAEEAVSALDGVSHVEILLSARVRDSMHDSPLLPGVKNVVAVASGKGGVGKSTVSVNLAVALAQSGAEVGLLDADVYGPSVPMMLGAAHERPMTQNQKIIPIEKYRLKTMSLGHLLEEGQAVLWRGPMVAGTVKQLLEDVDWGDLDYLIVDLPPGTGDAPMSLAQLVPLTGVVIVATPHDVAANIAGKSVKLFERLKAPIIGVIENMAGFVCPSCGAETKVFAGKSGEQLAAQFDVPFLGSIPLDASVSASGDAGVPCVIASPESSAADCFRSIAGRLAMETSKQAMAQQTSAI